MPNTQRSRRSLVFFLTIAFPVYIGITFVMVVLGGHLLLGEPLPMAKIAAVALILAGIALGMSSSS